MICLRCMLEMWSVGWSNGFVGINGQYFWIAVQGKCGLIVDCVCEWPNKPGDNVPFCLEYNFSFNNLPLFGCQSWNIVEKRRSCFLRLNPCDFNWTKNFPKLNSPIAIDLDVRTVIPRLIPDWSYCTLISNWPRLERAENKRGDDRYQG